MPWHPLKITRDEKELLEDKLGNDEEIARHVNKCVQACLVLGQKRLPIKKGDLTRLIFQANAHFKLVNAIITLANKDLVRIFGLRLYDVDDNANPRFLMVNSNKDLSIHIDHPDTIKKEMSILWLILLSVFTSPIDKVTEEQLLTTLGEFDIKTDLALTYINLFVNKLYLKIEKEQNVKFFRWGPRASAEVDLNEFFKLFLKIDGSTETQWPNLLAKVKDMTEEASRQVNEQA